MQVMGIFRSHLLVFICSEKARHKGHMLPDSIIKHPEQRMYTESRLALPGLGRGGHGNESCQLRAFFVGVMELF